MTQIFISYRRSGAHAQWAIAALERALKEHFGDENVFYDAADIPPGTDYPEYLLKRLNRTDLLLVLIEDGWAGQFNDERFVRDPPELDFVRLEIETSLQRRIVIIPILLLGANPLRAQDLPSSLQRLASLQSMWLRGGINQRADLAAIMGAINDSMGRKVSRRWAAVGLVAVVFAAVALASQCLFTRVPPLVVTTTTTSTTSSTSSSTVPTSSSSTTTTVTTTTRKTTTSTTSTTLPTIRCTMVRLDGNSDPQYFENMRVSAERECLNRIPAGCRRDPRTCKWPRPVDFKAGSNKVECKCDLEAGTGARRKAEGR